MSGKERTRKIIGIIFLILSVLCIGFAVFYFVQQAKQRAEAERLRQAVYVEKSAPVVETEPQTEEEPEQFIPIDFESLWEINTDVIAWITIPDTEIDYPILYSKTDNSAYLRHDMEGNYQIGGCIFIENYNSDDFSDFNTVVYGHRMDDTTMFAQLQLYRDKEFFDSHPEITIYTPTEILTYRIFAAYQFDDRHIILSYDYDSDVLRQRYIDEVYAVRTIDGNYDETVEVTADSRILTLSTCVKNDPSHRYLVQGVLVD